MAFLDYSGLSHFLDKLKTIFVGKSQGSTNAGKALYVNNSGNVDLLDVDDTPTENSTHLITSGGVWSAKNEKIDKKYELSFSSNWSSKTWVGSTSFYSYNIWTDGKDVYLSDDTSQYVLNKSTSTWSSKTWTGLKYINGRYVWTDGDNIYYSDSSNQYILDKSTSTWSVKEWTGLTSFRGDYIWTDGENIYYSNNSTQYVLDKSTSTWSAKEWTGLTSFNGNNVWIEGENIYHSSGYNQYILDKSTSTWSTKTWTGLQAFNGSNIWSDGNNIYYSNGTSSNQYILNKSASTWSAKEWTGLTILLGEYVWFDGENIYYSNSSNQYVLDKDNSNKILLGTNGEFSPVNVSEVLPSDMIGASASDVGTHGLVPAPAIADRDKFLKGDGTWMDVPGAKVITITGTISNTSGSYSGSISDDRVTSDMKAIELELGDPDAFNDDITVSCGNGSITISCSDFAGSSTIKISILETTEVSGNYIVYSASTAPSNPTAGMIWLKKV